MTKITLNAQKLLGFRLDANGGKDVARQGQKTSTPRQGTKVPRIGVKAD